MAKKAKIFLSDAEREERRVSAYDAAEASMASAVAWSRAASAPEDNAARLKAVHLSSVAYAACNRASRTSVEIQKIVDAANQQLADWRLQSAAADATEEKVEP